MTKEPFLDSRMLEEAKLVEEPGGLFSIRLKFNWEGAAILDSTTSSNPGLAASGFMEISRKRGGWRRRSSGSVFPTACSSSRRMRRTRRPNALCAG